MKRQGSNLFKACGAAMLAFVAISTPLRADDYPQRPVRIVVPSGAGGGYDVLGRIVGDALSRRFGQGFYIENKVGAGTIVGTQAVISSPPDGYTLLVGGLSNIVFNEDRDRRKRLQRIVRWLSVEISRRRQ